MFQQPSVSAKNGNRNWEQPPCLSNAGEYCEIRKMSEIGMLPSIEQFR